MGRYLPTECEHGVTIDWGDFGPCQDCSTDHDDDSPCPNYPTCAECVSDGAEALAAALIEQGWTPPNGREANDG